LRVPLAHGLLGSTLAGHDVVDRAVVLLRAQVRVLRRAVIEDLQLHAVVRGVALQRRADAHAVVAPGLELELEAEDEIRVLLLGQHHPAAFGGADQVAVLDGILAAGPTLKVRAIEQRNEPGLRVRGRYGSSECRDQNQAEQAHKCLPHRTSAPPHVG